MIDSFSKLFHKHFLSLFFKIFSVLFGIIEISSSLLYWLSSLLFTVFFLFFFLHWDKFCSFLNIIRVVRENVTNFTINIGEDNFLSFVFKFKKESISFVDHFIHNCWGLDGNWSDKLTCKFSQFSVYVWE